MFQTFFSNYNWMVIPAALAAIMAHEVCHGLAALLLGDPTAKEQKRLTFNPIRHIDIVGLVAIIVLRFGWAKPVPVDMRYFKNPKRDMALVALAGPASNFALAALSLFILGFMRNLPSSVELYVALYLFMQWLTVISVGLGIFNLIPVPPLDGFKIAGSFMPDSVYYRILRYERFGFIALIGLLYIPGSLDWLNVAREAVIDALAWVFLAPSSWIYGWM
jgi:Zn-dependent protease